VPDVFLCLRKIVGLTKTAGCSGARLLLSRRVSRRAAFYQTKLLIFAGHSRLAVLLAEHIVWDELRHRREVVVHHALAPLFEVDFGSYVLG
jgi:hypothetical protein